jgi:phospholipid transport system substrate-binding protein
MKLILRAIFAFLFIVNSSAALAYGNSESEAKEFVNKTSQKVMSIIRASNADGSKSQQLTNVFVDTMDIDWIAKFVLGKYWNTISDAEKSSYMSIYRSYLISSYVPLFKKYNHQDIVIESIKPLGNDQYMVSTLIKNENAESSYVVDYRLKFSSGTYKIRDIVAEGVSLLATQRSEFGAIVSNESITKLNQELKNKTTSNSQ